LIPWNFLPPIDSYINSAAAAAAAAARTAAAAASAAAATAAAAAATAVTAAASAAATATAADTAAAADTTAAAAASAATAATATAAATAVLPLLLPPVAISVQFVEHYCFLDYNILNSVQLAMTTNLHECMVSCGFVAAARAGVQSASAAAASSGDASGDAVAASSGDASGEAGPSKSAVIFGYIPKEANPRSPPSGICAGAGLDWQLAALAAHSNGHWGTHSTDAECGSRYNRSLDGWESSGFDDRRRTIARRLA
jgi:hypothetical protein